jgi:ubiquitin carboxyl-terminal hydrolase L5
MNVPEIDLGETLDAFKAETKNLKSPYRGKRLGDNVFIRNIHNSFARLVLLKYTSQKSLKLTLHK